MTQYFDERKYQQTLVICQNFPDQISSIANAVPATVSSKFFVHQIFLTANIFPSQKFASYSIL